MVQVTPQPPTLERTATIRALSSLTPRDAATVRAAVRGAGAAFTVEEHEDYDGYLSLLLSPIDRDGAAAFLVSGRTGAVDIAGLHDDEMYAIGRFASIGAAMIALGPDLEAPRPTAARRPERIARGLLDHHGSDAGLQAAMRADADTRSKVGRGTRWQAVLRAIDAVTEG